MSEGYLKFNLRGMKHILFSVLVGTLMITSVALFATSVAAAPVDVFNNSACSGNKVCQNDGVSVWNIIKNIINILAK